jgi:hypothetical protein
MSPDTSNGTLIQTDGRSLSNRETINLLFYWLAAVAKNIWKNKQIHYEKKV